MARVELKMFLFWDLQIGFVKTDYGRSQRTKSIKESVDLTPDPRFLKCKEFYTKVDAFITQSVPLL